MFRLVNRKESLFICVSFNVPAVSPALPGLAPEWYKWSFSWGRISLGGRPLVLAERIIDPIVFSTSGARS